jgi:hypothetical protein
MKKKIKSGLKESQCENKSIDELLDNIARGRMVETCKVLVQNLVAVQQARIENLEAEVLLLERALSLSCIGRSKSTSDVDGNAKRVKYFKDIAKQKLKDM